ncbi:hypothetical protein [Pseudoxanthomonas sp.]|jgi:hypothetical protein|uniref:hypothetical protein n=1 Tax=Pseudoxanthomonas sp. TaxID=1871049 RepID=UPI002FE0AAFC
MPLAENHAHDALPATGAVADGTIATFVTPLDDALHLLQTDPGHSLADPGLARLTPAGLDRLSVAARQQADRNHEGILLLLELLHVAQRTDAGNQGQLMPTVVRQLRHHVEDQHRWQSLADNAAFYRDNRQVAERIAARLLHD